MTYISVVFFGDDDHNTQRVQQMVASRLASRLDVGCGSWTVCCVIELRYHGGCLQQACEGRGTLVPLHKRTWTLIGGYGFVRVLKYIDVDPIRSLLALASSYKGNLQGGRKRLISVQI